MFATCPFCGSTVPRHGECCRVPAELDRFQRVFTRLTADHRFNNLEDRLAYYLREFGRVDATGVGGF